MTGAGAPRALRVLFLGSGAFGLPTVEAIAREHELVGVVTQPDRPAGRGMKLTPSPIGAWASERVDPARVFKPENINDRAVVEALRALGADAWVVIAYGQKLGPALLEGVFAINLHASRLPRWRGAAPINHAIWAGDETTGNSVITLADRMDAGLVLGTSERPIDPLVTTGELHDLLAQDGPVLVLRVLDEHARGALRPSTQDEALVTHARKLRKEDGVIDFAWDAPRIRRTVHALNPWPGVGVRLGGVTIKLLRVQDLTGHPDTPSMGLACGTVADRELGTVVCGGGTMLRILEVQPEGKRPLAWSDFARGFRFPEPAVLEGGTR